MFYDMLFRQSAPLNWPETEYGVRAVRKSDGSIVRVPVGQMNVLTVGTTRYGKTVFTKACVREVFREDPERYAVFFQIKPDDFTGEFMRPEDKIITFSDRLCRKENLFRWNLVKEIRSRCRDEWESVLEEMASVLFADLLADSRNRVWAEAAKETWKAFVRVILYQYQNNPSNKKLISAMQHMTHKDFLKFLAEYRPNRSILRDNFAFDPEQCEHYAMPRKGSDIMFFLQNVIGKFGGSFLAEDGEDTIWDYLHGAYGKRLFLVHDHKKRDSAKLFEQYFLKTIGDEMLSLTSGFRGKMLWVLDEIDKVEHDFGLTQAVTLGQQFGLQVLVSTQSLESLYAVAPEFHGEHLTRAALAGFPVTAAFHPGDPHTIETLQKLYGKCRKQTLIMPLSRYEPPVVTTEQEYMVEDSDFASLGVGECYIKVRSSQPERLKILEGGTE